MKDIIYVIAGALVLVVALTAILVKVFNDKF